MFDFSPHCFRRYYRPFRQLKNGKDELLKKQRDIRGISTDVVSASALLDEVHSFFFKWELRSSCSSSRHEAVAGLFLALSSFHLVIISTFFVALN